MLEWPEIARGVIMYISLSELLCFSSSFQHFLITSIVEEESKKLRKAFYYIGPSWRFIACAWSPAGSFK